MVQKAHAEQAQDKAEVKESRGEGTQAIESSSAMSTQDRESGVKDLNDRDKEQQAKSNESGSARIEASTGTSVANLFSQMLNKAQPSEVATKASNVGDIVKTIAAGTAESVVDTAKDIGEFAESAAEWVADHKTEAIAAGVVVAAVGVEVATAGLATPLVVGALAAAGTPIEVGGIVTAGALAGKAAVDVYSHGDIQKLYNQEDLSPEEAAEARERLKEDTGDAMVMNLTVGAGFALKALSKAGGAAVESEGLAGKGAAAVEAEGLAGKGAAASEVSQTSKLAGTNEAASAGMKAAEIDAGPMMQFRKTASVRAEVSKEAFGWNDWQGNRMTAAAGDIKVVQPNGNISSVKPDIFAQTYSEVAQGEYVKTAITNAQQLKKDAIIQTLEGQGTGKAGDWMVTGPQGENYIIAKEEFAKLYKSIND